MSQKKRQQMKKKNNQDEFHCVWNKINAKITKFANSNCVIKRQ